MKRGLRSEHALIDELARVFAPGRARSPALVGIGDDAAVLSASTGPHVWTVDACVENVHFELRWLTPADIGARSFHAAVSDIAAMGARPRAALSSLVVPASFSRQKLLALVKGQAAASRELGCPIVGGNLSRGGDLSVTTTVLGIAKRPVTRNGAKAGDEVWLFGDVGLAGAGLALLRRRRPRPRRDRASERALGVCVAAWRRPRALIREGQRLPGRAHAAIDVSDGLLADAGHIARASGVRIVLEESRLTLALRAELAIACRALGESALSFALGGGEDYALVATGPRSARPRGARPIGRVERGRGVEVESADGARRVPDDTGFDHFRSRE